MRRAVVVLILMVLLLVVMGLNRLAADWRVILDAPPGGLLYVAAFDGFIEDWQQYDGRLAAQIDDGRLRVTVDAPRSTPYSTARPSFGDFDLRVQARAAAGPLNNAYGVVFRLVDARNFYAFLISSDGYYRVVRYSGGAMTLLSNWIPSPQIEQGLDAVNWLRVVGRGGEFRFFVNDTPLELCVPNSADAVSTFVEGMGCIDGQMRETLTDDAFTVGQLGVIVDVSEDRQPGVVVEFDNLLVFMPETAAST